MSDASAPRRVLLQLVRNADDAADPLLPELTPVIIDDLPADELLEQIFAADVVLVA